MALVQIDNDELLMRPSLVDAVYVKLKHAILESDFPPNLIISENDLVQRYNISRTPIRAACIRLQTEGLLTVIAKKGIQIQAIAPQDLREIFAVIIAIESEAARLSAQLNHGQRQMIRENLDHITHDMAQALNDCDFNRRNQADALFHQQLIYSCGNSRFLTIMNMVNAQAHRARTITAKMRKGLEQSIHEHFTLALHIGKGEPEQAALAARLHRERARDEILPLIETYGLKHL